jgi:DNA-binding beta-propeller fold protein YncE
MMVVRHVNRHRRLRARRRIAITTLLFGLGTVLACLSAQAQDSSSPSVNPMSVPAEFIRYLSPPGTANHFLRPSAVVVDRRHDEVLVTDSGRGRVIIFDTQGTYLFEFGGFEHFTSPIDLAVDSEGYIYILGSTSRGGRLFRFDFDGVFMYEVGRDLTAPDGGRLDLRDLAIDASDRLYVLDQSGLQVLVLDREGPLLDQFQLVADMSPEDRREMIIGSMAIMEDRIYVPNSMLGTVHVHALDGDFLHNIGYSGGTVGEFSFPVAVDVSSDGLVMVLDNHRFNVLCFNREGKFLGEFGGRGFNPGWFYHPTLLAVDPLQQAYVGQIFQNKVQVCRIPGFILNALDRESDTVAPAVVKAAGVVEDEALDDGRPFAVHVGSFRNAAAAEADLQRYAVAGYSGRTVTTELRDRSTWHRNYIGRFATIEEATVTAAALLDRGLTDFAEAQRVTP